MVKSLYFIFGILLVIVLAFWYLNSTATPVPTDFSDATADDRCKQFEERDPELGVSSLGYKGRIRQLLHGCF